MRQAAIWDETHGMRSLWSVLVDSGLDLTGWTLSTATGISDDGMTVVGFGENPDGNTEGFIAILPETSTLSLLAGAAVWMLGRRDQRQRGREKGK